MMPLLAVCMCVLVGVAAARAVVVRRRTAQSWRGIPILACVLVLGACAAATVALCGADRIIEGWSAVLAISLSALAVATDRDYLVVRQAPVAQGADREPNNGTTGTTDSIGAALGRAGAIGTGAVSAVAAIVLLMVRLGWL